MRMQKTDMEFVTFDAQDVIATSWQASVSGYPDKFFMQGSVAREYNDQCTGFDFAQIHGQPITYANRGNELDSLYFAYDSSDYLNAAPTDKWTSKTAAYGGTYLNAVDAQTAGYTQLNDVQAVVTWLTVHGYTWQ